MKTCSKCNMEKDLEEFGDRTDRDIKSKRNDCKECNRASCKQRHHNNKEYRNLLSNQYYYKNKEELNKKSSEYAKNNRAQMNEYSRKSYLNETNEQRLRRQLRDRLRKAIKNNTKSGSAVSDLGCSVEFLKQYLESMFTPDMTWANHGKVWHIDHRYPLAKANLENRDELLIVVHYTNLQPMLATTNLSKGGNLDLTDLIVIDIQNKINNIRGI